MKPMKITKDQALIAIQSGEFGNDVIASSKNVVVVLTQDWCAQWRTMQTWIHALDLDGGLYELEYNLEDYFEEFKKFKETKWRNGLIPYVRYYVNGKLVGESNYVSREEFLKKFE